MNVDYLVIGAGAAGLCFTDSLVASSDATVAIIDRRAEVGGHWNDAYPFVKLHQPSSSYGLNTKTLGSGQKYSTGVNAGYYELASGSEVLGHFRSGFQDLVDSGRVRFFGRHEINAEGRVVALDTGEPLDITPRKIVDATFSQVNIPATHKRNFEVDPAISCEPVGRLPELASSFDRFVLVGAGKTAMDAGIWMIENGIPPEKIRWVRARDYWLINRGRFQPGSENFLESVRLISNEAEAFANAGSVDEFYSQTEAWGNVFRIDPSVTPTGHHCAFISSGELELLRRIDNVVRLGRVRTIGETTTVFQNGELDTWSDALHIDASATGLPHTDPVTIFNGDRITLQLVRLCQPTYSYSILGHIEANVSDDQDKNQLVRPIPVPDTPLQWVKWMGVEYRNRHVGSQSELITSWQATSRLDQFLAEMLKLTPDDTEVIAELNRYGEHVRGAAENIPNLVSAAG